MLAEHGGQRSGPGRHRRRAWASRPWTPGRSRPSSTQVIAEHPDDWTQFVEGDDKARGKLTGFFVGQVMKATKGQADGKAVTALLRQKAGS